MNQASAAETAPATFSLGQWIASQGVYNDEPRDWWDITVNRGSPEYSYKQNLAMVFNSDEKAEANATVMAAAPDLLDAIRLVSSGGVADELCWCDDVTIKRSHEHSLACLTARAAVAKATKVQN